jgi:Zn-dependent peptidase ImmA (M78 family)
LLFHSGGIDFRSMEILNSLTEPHLSIEVACNRFANVFLVPPSEFESIGLKISESEFEKLAERFSVSREVILRNYLDRGLVDEDYYRKMAAKWSTITIRRHIWVKPIFNWHTESITKTRLRLTRSPIT